MSRNVPCENIGSLHDGGISDVLVLLLLVSSMPEFSVSEVPCRRAFNFVLAGSKEIGTFTQVIHELSESRAESFSTKRFARLGIGAPALRGIEQNRAAFILPRLSAGANAEYA